MLNLLENKLVRLALAFCFGIAGAFYSKFFIQLSLFLFTLSIILFCYIIVKFYKKSFFKISTPLEIISLCLSTSLGGILLYARSTSVLDKDFFNDVKYYSFTTLQEEQHSEKFNSCLISLDKIYKNDRWIRIEPVNCKIFIRNNNSINLDFGQSYVAKGKIQINSEDSKYYSNNKKKQLFYTTFVKKNCIIKLENKKQTYSFQYACNKILSFLRSKLRSHIDDDDIYGVVLALTLGDKSFLNRTIQKHYSESGTIHVLAVSGLHVGMVYLLLQYILSILLLGTSRKKQDYINIISIIALWFYAGITGFSPSVLRASLMFSLVGLGKILNKNTSIFSTLGLSAIILLLFSPLMLLDLGFQLSYLAVIGIGALSNVISNFIKSEKKILSTLCDLTSMSLSAQIATLPILLYTFSKFPVYFIPANWIVVPLASLILNLGVAVIAFGSLPIVGSVLISITKLIVKFSNWYVKFITELPFHQITEINISLFQTLTLSFFIIYLFIFWETRKLYSCISTLLFFNILVATLIIK